MVEESTSFTYDALGRLVRATVSSGSDVTVSSYTYDYLGNRTSKTTAEETVYFITETMGSLSQVLAEVNADGSELAYYTRSDELISMETEGETYTYLSDGHSDVRALTNSAGEVTDTYRFDAYGVLLSKTGDTRNEYLYAGEQYNAETGLYYNRARYMDPTTGTFISMDSYSGSIYDPVSLHKYLYANANPVTYTDPTGYFSFSELMVTQKIQGIINSVQMSSGLFKVLRWVNAIVTVYDVFQQIKGLVEEGKSVEEIVAVMLKDGAIDLLLDGLCSTKIGFILKPVLFVFSLGVQTNQLVWAWTEGTTMDKIMYTAQAIAMVFGLAQQCFTGDTLVWTENGAIVISEVAIGDEIYAFDAETGEAILAKVTDISVSETDELVHLTIGGELICTTASHPFYTTSGEWKAAGDLKVGDRVVTMTGEATVEATEVEKLSEAVTVYNLTVEGAHNYYVAENGVLVHNECDVADSANQSGKGTVENKGFNSFDDLKKYLGSPGEDNAWHHIVEQSQIGKSGFSSNEINNVNNIISIPHGKGTVHAKISGYYSSIPASGFTNGLTVRQWLSGQSFQQQFDFGMNVLKQYGNVIETGKGWQFVPFD